MAKTACRDGRLPRVTCAFPIQLVRVETTGWFCQSPRNVIACLPPTSLCGDSANPPLDPRGTRGGALAVLWFGYRCHAAIPRIALRAGPQRKWPPCPQPASQAPAFPCHTQSYGAIALPVWHSPNGRSPCIPFTSSAWRTGCHPPPEAARPTGSRTAVSSSLTSTRMFPLQRSQTRVGTGFLVGACVTTHSVRPCAQLWVQTLLGHAYDPRLSSHSPDSSTAVGRRLAVLPRCAVTVGCG